MKLDEPVLRVTTPRRIGPYYVRPDHQTDSLVGPWNYACGTDRQREVEDAVRRISLKNAAIPTSLRYDPHAHRLLVYLHARDRDLGEPTEVGLAFPVPDGVDLRAFIYEVVRHAWLHELDEAWHLDGVRERDPHAPWSPPL